MIFSQITDGSADAEKVWLSVESNNEDIPPDTVVEWTATTTDADQGRLVERVDTAVNVTTGIAAKVAGVTKTTIATSAVNLIQVKGPANVRASASIAASRLVVASSINATNIGHVTEASQSTATGPEYHGALVGWTLENGPNATNSTVYLDLL